MTYKTKKHYEANKKDYILRAHRNRLALKELVRKLKSENPCTDCGKSYPYYVMDFDHIGTDKTAEVNKYVARGMRKKCLKEIAKCQLVCSNCHRIRTYTRLAQ